MRPVIYFNPIALPKTKHYVYVTFAIECNRVGNGNISNTLFSRRPLWNRHVVYPKFTPGDPQLRMFLPPFWMKMLYPGEKCPKRLAVFKVHPQLVLFSSLILGLLPINFHCTIKGVHEPLYPIYALPFYCKILSQRPTN